jgi:predicted transcriptional regulator
MKIRLDEEIIKFLKEYNLNSYEAKAYYVLLLLGKATATSIAREAQIPQQRVYDALRSLERKGFIHVKNTNPKKYIPLPPRKALNNRIRQLRLEFEIKEDNLKKLIEKIEKKIPKVKFGFDEGFQVFILEGKESIVNQAISMISSAESIVKIAGIKPLFTLGCKGNLDKYLKKHVKILAMGEFDMPCKEEIKKLGGEYCEAPACCQYLVITDDKKLLIVYFDEKGVPNGLYTENEAIIKPFLFFFEEQWKKCVSKN